MIWNKTSTLLYIENVRIYWQMMTCALYVWNVVDIIIVYFEYYECENGLVIMGGTLVKYCYGELWRCNCIELYCVILCYVS